MGTVDWNLVPGDRRGSLFLECLKAGVGPDGTSYCDDVLAGNTGTDPHYQMMTDIMNGPKDYIHSDLIEKHNQWKPDPATDYLTGKSIDLVQAHPTGGPNITGNACTGFGGGPLDLPAGCFPGTGQLPVGQSGVQRDMQGTELIPDGRGGFVHPDLAGPENDGFSRRFNTMF